MPNLTREEWLKERHQSIGASEAASALGLNPWKSPYQLWAEKTGLITAPDLSDNEAILWGKKLEAPVADHYSAVTGRNILNLGEYAIQRNPDIPFLTATLDRMIIAGNNTPHSGCLEVKTTGSHNSDDWDNEPPLYYQVQLHQQMLVTGLSWGSLAVLIGGQKFKYSDHYRREDFERWLVQQLKSFWLCVETRTPPPVDGSYSTRETLHRIFHQESDGIEIYLPDESQEWATKLDQLRDEIKHLEGAKQALENQLKAAIGEASKGILPDGSSYIWKLQKKAGYTVEPSEVRVLRRVKK